MSIDTATPVAGKSAPVKAAKDVKAVKAVTLANANGAAQAKAIRDALAVPFRDVLAAALKATQGDAQKAAALVGDGIRAGLFIIARVVPILRSPAPADCFTDRNNRGARVGDLFATPFGLNAIYRDANKADLKAARQNLGAAYGGKAE